MTLAKPPVAVRSCNPGNLRVGQQWLGLCAPQQMTSEQKASPKFCAFMNPAYGFRALALDLLNAERRGRDTISKIIQRYAPPNENNTGAYVRAVAQMTGMEATAVLDLVHSDAQLSALCRAIAVQESGGWFFSADDLAAGIRMARGHS